MTLNTDSPAVASALFANAFAMDACGSVTLPELVDAIRTGSIQGRDFAGLITDVRAGTGDKCKLPAVSLSLHCLTRRKDATPEEKDFKHTGFLQCDFDGKDHPGWDMAGTLQRLKQDAHAAAVFISPSGTGIKVFVRIPADLDTHRAAWLTVADYFLRTHKLKVDKSTKDATRLCFLSHHPEACFNADSLAFEVVTPRREIQTEPGPIGPIPETGPIGPLPTPEGWIIKPSGDVGNYESAKSAFSAMKKTGRFFLRGGNVCELRANQIDLIKSTTLCSTIETCGAPVASWLKDRDGKPVLVPNSRVSKENADMWLASNARHEELDEIKGLVSCPPLVFDGGSLKLLSPGYHKPSQSYVLDGVSVDTNITHREALDTFDLLLRDFEFVTPADRARALAMIISPALTAGGLLQDHIPLFVVEAKKSQSGKGYLCEVVQTIYHAIAAIVTLKEGGVGSFDESLASSLVGGRQFVQLDNVRGKLASQFFEMVLTCPRGGTVPCRTPGRAEIQIDPSRTIFHCTSNGLAMTEDLANRACIIRIRKRENWNPPMFPEGGLAEHVSANRGRFLGAIYHIAGRWVEAGKPRTTDTRAPGRFRAWGQTLDWIVQELAGCPPLLDGHQQVQERVANPGLVWLREIGARVFEHPDAHEPWRAARLVELSAESGISIPSVKQDATEENAARAVGRLFSNLFREQETLHVDEILVEREETPAERPDGNGTRMLKTYRFTRLSPQSPQSPQYSTTS